MSVPRREAEDALSESAQYVAQRCDPVVESEVDRLRRELAEALQEEDVEEPSEATSDDIEDWAKRVSRFVGVAWDEKRRKWKVTLNELDGKDRTIGRYDDEREAAYARNKAVLDAGLEGRRRMNAVVLSASQGHCFSVAVRSLQASWKPPICVSAIWRILMASSVGSVM